MFILGLSLKVLNRHWNIGLCTKKTYDYSEGFNLQDQRERCRQAKTTVELLTERQCPSISQIGGYLKAESAPFWG